MRKIFFLVIMVGLSCSMWAKQQRAFVAYIEQYRVMAITQQSKHGIPAAITMAQALLESQAGQSELARQANNHFGVKCTSDWPGLTYSHTDDRSDECFRKYSDAADSYEDHSLFLLRKRYEMLFRLPIGDYQNWAYGLKSCGYATDPKYPEKLIRIIETYGLQDLTFDTILVASGKVSRADTAFTEPIELKTPVQRLDSGDYEVAQMENIELFQEHTSGRRNGVRFVVAQRGETFASLAAFFNMYEKTLRRYNDALDTRELQAGDLVYLYPKKHRADRRHPYCQFKAGETAWSISQKYGIRMRDLYKMNGIPYGTPLKTSQKLRLR